MTERVNIGKDGERTIGMAGGEQWKGQGIPGRAGNDGGGSWNDGGAKGMVERVNIGKDKGENSGKDRDSRSSRE